jgi:hypothetical protein
MRKPTLSSRPAQPLGEEAGHRQISELRGKGYRRSPAFAGPEDVAVLTRDEKGGHPATFSIAVPSADG